MSIVTFILVIKMLLIIAFLFCLIPGNMLSSLIVLLTITVMRRQIADFNPGESFDQTFTVSLLNISGKEEFTREPHCSQVTGKCDEVGIYWKNADKFQFRFRFLYLLVIVFVWLLCYKN